MCALIQGEMHYLEQSDTKAKGGWRVRAIKNKVTYSKYFKTEKQAFKFFKGLLFGTATKV